MLFSPINFHFSRITPSLENRSALLIVSSNRFSTTTPLFKMSANPLSIDATFPLTGSQHKIPQIGFGVYLSPKDVCVKSCKKAFDAGYRHIDTAQYYANEEQVGQALAESGLPRKDVYITSKVLSPAEDVESTYEKVAESVEKLAGKDGYADLFLVHSPNGGKEARKTMWLALVLAQDRGKVRDIGVSNYGIQHIEEMSTIHVEEVSTARKGAVLPVVNQIEVRNILFGCIRLDKLTNERSSILGANNARLSSIVKTVR